VNEPRFIDIDGTRTRYFEAGRGDPLVLIHGGQFGQYYSAYHWSRNLDDLASDFHVYAPDTLGLGYTDNPRDGDQYTPRQTVEHVRRYLLRMGIRDAVLMGHSRGALPAVRIAIDHPELVRAVVIVSSATLAANPASDPAGFYARLEADPPPVPDEPFVRREPEANSWSRDHITADFVAEMLAIANLPKTREARDTMERLPRGRYLADVRELRDDTLARIRDGGLRAPTLIAWGRDDPSAAVETGYRLFMEIAPSVPHSEFHVFNQAGHYLFRERAKEIDRLVATFVHASAG
jgi:2-hydroxy-6-oxo-6-(2'-carboxyphenyl)-hexa-2,4-dienoate hydrolase